MNTLVVLHSHLDQLRHITRRAGMVLVGPWAVIGFGMNGAVVAARCCEAALAALSARC